MATIRVFLVDDHPVFLEGLYTILSLRDPDIEVVGTASNGQEALDACGALEPDVVLLDIKMPVMDGVEAARKLKELLPDAAIIMLTTFDDRPLIRDALAAGAQGYLLKDAEAGQIVEAIKHVMSKNIVISGDLALRLTTAPTDRGDPELQSTDTRRLVPEERPSRDPEIVRELSARQIEILSLLASGKSNLEISQALFLSEKTVRNYISQIYEIINVHSRTKATLWALSNLPGLRSERDTQP